LQIRPYREVYLWLGDLLMSRSQPRAALTNYLTLVQFAPSSFTHVKAGDALSMLGRSGEAIEQYRAALKLSPDLVSALNNLAWILATDPAATNRNGDEAVQLAERAKTLTEQQVPGVVGTLAAAYAEAGRFDDAIKTAEAARTLAACKGDRPLTEKNGKLLELYKTGRPYREQLPFFAPPSGTRP